MTDTPKTQQLVLLRGHPGAGKSTFANTLCALDTRRMTLAVEQDQWRGYGADRHYDKKYDSTARAYCIGQTANFLRGGFNVIVSNTFSQILELHPYFMIAAELRDRGHNIVVTVLHVQGPVGRSVHGPNVEYDRYISTWEDYKGEYENV